METLPAEMVAHILSFLTDLDATIASMVCRTFYDLKPGTQVAWCWWKMNDASVHYEKIHKYEMDADPPPYSSQRKRREDKKKITTTCGVMLTRTDHRRGQRRCLLWGKFYVEWVANERLSITYSNLEDPQCPADRWVMRMCVKKDKSWDHDHLRDPKDPSTFTDVRLVGENKNLLPLAINPDHWASKTPELVCKWCSGGPSTERQHGRSWWWVDHWIFDGKYTATPWTRTILDTNAYKLLTHQPPFKFHSKENISVLAGFPLGSIPNVILRYQDPRDIVPPCVIWESRKNQFERELGQFCKAIRLLRKSLFPNHDAHAHK